MNKNYDLSTFRKEPIIHSIQLKQQMDAGCSFQLVWLRYFAAEDVITKL